MLKINSLSEPPVLSSHQTQATNRQLKRVIILCIIVYFLHADEIFEDPPFFRDNPLDAHQSDNDKDDPKDLYKSESHIGKYVIQNKGSEANP